MAARRLRRTGRTAGRGTGCSLAQRSGDAVQKRVAAQPVRHTRSRELKGWLTGVAPGCLDMLRSRKRDGGAVAHQVPERSATAAREPTPSRGTAGPLGRPRPACFVVLDTLARPNGSPLCCTTCSHAVRESRLWSGDPRPLRGQLASPRATGCRERGRCPTRPRRQARSGLRFLAALRSGDFEGLVAVLDPDVWSESMPRPQVGRPREVRGATAWAKGAIAFSRGGVEPVDPTGARERSVGIVVAPRGRLFRVLSCTIADGRSPRSTSSPTPSASANSICGPQLRRS